MNYISLDQAKQLRELGDQAIRQTISAPSPTTSYEPAPWEWRNAEERLSRYKAMGGVGRVFAASRDATIRLILSMESILCQTARNGDPVSARKRDPVLVCFLRGS